MSNRSGIMTEGKPKKRSTTSHLSSGSYFLRAWTSYAVIGASCALGLGFVIYAQSNNPDISAAEALSSGTQTSTFPVAESETETVESEQSDASVFESIEFDNSEFDGIESTPIRQAAHERGAEFTQPTRVELTSGGDLRSDSPVRLLGEIHLLEEDGSLLGTISVSTNPSSAPTVDLLELTPVEVDEPQADEDVSFPPLFP